RPSYDCQVMRFCLARTAVTECGGNREGFSVGSEHSGQEFLTTPQVQPAFEPILNSKEAASLLGIHEKTLQRLAREGGPPGIRIGKLWRFRASALNRWLESKTAPSGHF